MTIPDSAAVGYVHGKALIPQRVILDVGTLTLRAADNPPETDISVFPHANRSEDSPDNRSISNPIPAMRHGLICNGRTHKASL